MAGCNVICVPMLVGYQQALKGNVLHLSRYYPAYQMDQETTPIDRMLEAKEAAKGHLRYVYMGNMPPGVDKNTYCPQCSETIVNREKKVTVENLVNNRCRRCGEKIAIIL